MKCEDSLLALRKNCMRLTFILFPQNFSPLTRAYIEIVFKDMAKMTLI